MVIKWYEKGCGPMFANTLRKIIEKFDEMGIFEVKRRRGRKSIAY